MNLEQEVGGDRSADAGSRSVRVREAVSSDWSAVAALLAELGRPDVRVDPDAESVGRQMYEQYLRRHDARALVAERAGHIVGLIDVEFRTWLNIPGLQAWIPDLIVTEDSRGQGVGSALLLRVEEIARSKPCWSMALESANFREAAHAFYISHGWKPLANTS